VEAVAGDVMMGVLFHMNYFGEIGGLRWSKDVGMIGYIIISFQLRCDTRRDWRSVEHIGRGNATRACALEERRGPGL